MATTQPTQTGTPAVLVDTSVSSVTSFTSPSSFSNSWCSSSTTSSTVASNNNVVRASLLVVVVVVVVELVVVVTVVVVEVVVVVVVVVVDGIEVVASRVVSGSVSNVKVGKVVAKPSDGISVPPVTSSVGWSPSSEASPLSS